MRTFLQISKRADYSTESYAIKMPPNNIEFFESSEQKDNNFDLVEFFKAIFGWIARSAHGINDESEYSDGRESVCLKIILFRLALAHPYYIAFALFVVYAWPHIIALPFWFGQDGYRRMESQTRRAISQVTTRGRPRRKRAYYNLGLLDYLVIIFKFLSR